MCMLTYSESSKDSCGRFGGAIIFTEQVQMDMSEMWSELSKVTKSHIKEVKEHIEFIAEALLSTHLWSAFSLHWHDCFAKVARE